MRSAPYYFVHESGLPATLSPADYLTSKLTYRFPAGHRLAGDRKVSDLEPMRRDLFRLFVRLDYDGDPFRDFLAHGITELVLPFCSPRVGMSHA